MPCTMTVLYPPGSFKLDYYTEKHMPMVAEQFGPYGFKGYRVTKILATPQPGQEPSFQVQCAVDFAEGPEQIEEALKACGEKVLGDIPNFTDTQPTLLIGDVVAVK